MSGNLEDLISRNTRANQPAFGQAGRLYYVTDENVLERDSGSAWENVGTSPAQVSAGEKTAGTETALRTFSPDDVKDMIDTHAGTETGYDYILIQDQKTANTNGGTFTAGAWRTRDLNTEVSDVGGHASVASNQITLAAGTYDADISAPAYRAEQHKAILYNVTDGADILVGSSAFSTSNAISSQTVSIIKGRFTLAAQKVLEVRHRSIATQATNGFGVASNLDSKIEIYTSVELRKVA